MKKTKGHSIHSLFVLLLFCVFAGSVLLTLMLGVKAYSSMKASADTAHSQRTALSYILEKVRHNDRQDAAEISEFGGGPALILSENIDGTDYETIIYVYENKLRELFREKDLELPADAGSEILDAKSVEFIQLTEQSIQIKYTDPENRFQTATVYLRSGRAAQ